MKIKTSGFTLMEIMVVIIVVAVLASVAGPMIGSVTDQGRESATKSKMSSLKSAIIAYKNDIGRYPSYGDPKQAASYDASKILQNTEEGNVLATDKWTLFDGAADKVPEATYSKKWTGPYMDSLPEDFMFDSWGNRIQYLVHEKNLYLWSPGADNIYNVSKFPNGGTDDNDDIIVSIARFRKSFFETSEESKVIDLNGASAVLDFGSATSFPGS